MFEAVQSNPVNVQSIDRSCHLSILLKVGRTLLTLLFRKSRILGMPSTLCAAGSLSDPADGVSIECQACGAENKFVLREVYYVNS